MGWAFMLFPFLLSLFAPSIRKPSYSRFVSRWDAAWRPQRFGRDPSRVPKSEPYPYDALQRWLERKQQETRPSNTGNFRDDYFDSGPGVMRPEKCGKEPFLNIQIPSALARYESPRQRYGTFPSGKSSAYPLVTNSLSHRLVHDSNRPGAYGRQAVNPYRKTFQALADLLQLLSNQHQGKTGNGAWSANRVVQVGRFPLYDRQAENGNKQPPFGVPHRDLFPWGSSTSHRPVGNGLKVKVKWSPRVNSKVILSNLASGGRRQQHYSRGTFGKSLYLGPYGSSSGSSLYPGSSGGTSGSSLYSSPHGGTSANSLDSSPPGNKSDNSLYRWPDGGTSGSSLYSKPSGGLSGDSHNPRPFGGISGDSHHFRPFGGISGDSHHFRPSGGMSGDSHLPRPSGHRHSGYLESNAILPSAFRKTREAGSRNMH